METITKKKRVLIAVQNGIINLDLTKRIQKDGFETESIISLDIEKLKQTDLIILEDSLEEKFEKYKAMIDKYGVPVIFLTSRKMKNNNMNLLMPFLDTELSLIIKFAFRNKINNANVPSNNSNI